MTLERRRIGARALLACSATAVVLRLLSPPLKIKTRRLDCSVAVLSVRLWDDWCTGRGETGERISPVLFYRLILAVKR